jgi:serine/threonine-protein kinase
MATVFLARAEGMGGFERDVAVKLLHDHLRENADLAFQLVNEARISAKIRHPNVVQVHDVGEDPSGIFLVMEYVEGDTLSGLQRAARAAGETVPIAIALRILTDALAGLHSAHELRDGADQPLEIVHRDFSPQNILVGTDGISRLTDFGIAKAARRDGHTRPGLIKGKIGYMAPEQARGKSVDRRCDVWAAGVVAWELLAGRPLRANEDEVATLLEVVSGDPPDVRTACPEIAAALAEAVSSALTGTRDQRCPTADGLRQRLIEAWRLQGQVLADSAEVAAYVRRFGRPPEEPKTPSPWTQGLESVPTSHFNANGPGQLFGNTATLPSLAMPALPVTETGRKADRTTGRVVARGSLLLVGLVAAGALMYSSGLMTIDGRQKTSGHAVSPMASAPQAQAQDPLPLPQPTAPTKLARENSGPGGLAWPDRATAHTTVASTRGDRDRRQAVPTRHHVRSETGPSRVKVARVRPVVRSTSAPAPSLPAGKSPPPLAGNPYAANVD